MSLGKGVLTLHFVQVLLGVHPERLDKRFVCKPPIGSKARRIELVVPRVVGLHLVGDPGAAEEIVNAPFEQRTA